MNDLPMRSNVKISTPPSRDVLMWASVALSILLPIPVPAQPGKATDSGYGSPVNLSVLSYQPVKLEPNNRRSRWLVPVTINGKSCKLLLDTGADFIILSSWAPKFLGVTTKPTTIQAMTVGGTRKLVVGESSLKLGTTTIAKQHLRAIAPGNDLDIPDLKKKESSSTDTSLAPNCGVMGLNALRGLGVALDIRRHTLWIPADPATRVAAAMSRLHAASIPIKRTVKSGHMVIEGKVGDRKLRMILDSGAERTVLFGATAEAMKLPLTKGNALIDGANDANRRPMQGVLTNVTFGEASLPQLPVMVVPLKEITRVLSDGESSPIDGIIGADVHEHGGGIIDVAANTLYLTGNDPDAPPKSQ